MVSPTICLSGERVALGPIDRDLLALYHQWDNDFSILALEEGSARPSTLEATERWYEEAAKSTRDCVFTIYERSTLRPIGRTALHDIINMDILANEFEKARGEG